MDKMFLAPGEIANSWIGIGKKKANLPIMKMILLGIFAGVFVGFGAHADIIVMQTLGKTVDVGFAKFMGAAMFPVGIILVVVAGAELFTGNCLIAVSVLTGEEKMKNMLKNWTFVYIGNFIGSIALAFLLAKSGLYGEAATAKAIAIAEGKANLAMSPAIIRGIMCNIMVVLAVWMQSGAKDITGKVCTLWFPVMAFVLSGFEHSIANMFFIPLGKFLGANLTWAQMWVNNIIPVTIGNIIGGAIIVPFVYWYIYVHDLSEKSYKKHLSK
ncbi:formate/nitrite transporter [Dethiosulfatibacter aminovorans DSM 17477]|uniref:Formate/nitrite transporter n=1 Tax=Dethiosulfatibacter aminovorans DSM 17477 TaxID=1121476 RepID=A0A1M6E514_9FIRM|nr:formate/nitrite transporter family protein [Dethiosulfatibacter aminovorans]SHI80587.1 formate/nitrite transporter [Dethiosulfatibacter aminovorans DSM 17477]